MPPLKRPGCVWLLLMGPAALIAVAVLVGKPQSGTAESAADAPISLPSDATDITYYLGNAYPVRCYNFRTSEDAFVAWASSQSNLRRVDRIGHQLLTPILAQNRKVRLEPIPNSEYIYFSWSEEERGQHAAFHRVGGRGYYFAHTR